MMLLLRKLMLALILIKFVLTIIKLALLLLASLPSTLTLASNPYVTAIMKYLNREMFWGDIQYSKTLRVTE